MRNYKASLELKGRLFHASVFRFDDGLASERVRIEGGNEIHYSEFPASNIGNADWNEYTRVMLQSIAEQFFRGKLAMGIKCQYINNGRLFDCVALDATDNNGFREIAIRVTGKSKSVLYHVGSHHWVLPSTLFPIGASKQKRDCVETKIGAIALSEFRNDKLPKPRNR